MKKSKLWDCRAYGKETSLHSPLGPFEPDTGWGPGGRTQHMRCRALSLGDWEGTVSCGS